jgi:hypothetical protein
MAARLAFKAALLASLIGACTKEGQSVVPVDVTDVSSLGLARVRVTVSSLVSGKSWPVEHAWSDSPLRLGVYLPADVQGDVATIACGIDSGGRTIASGTGNTVSVTPGHEAALVTVMLDGNGPALGGCVPGTGGAGGTGGMAGNGGAGGMGGTGGVGGTAQGSINIANATYRPPVDLTTEGTLDWAHWEFDQPDGPLIFDHRVSGNEISNLTPPASAMLRAQPGGGDFSWSDGMPTPTATDDPDGVYLGYPGMPASLSLTVEAATTPRTLRLYIGASGAATNVTATLSDGSAPAATRIVQTNPGTIDINFQAASSQATLSVKWAFDSQLGSTDVATMFVWAATLFPTSN